MASRNLTSSFNKMRQETHSVPDSDKDMKPAYISYFEKIDLIFTEIKKKLSDATKNYNKIILRVFDGSGKLNEFKTELDDLSKLFNTVRLMFDKKKDFDLTFRGTHRMIIANMYKSKLDIFEKYVGDFRDIKEKYISLIKKQNSSDKSDFVFGDVVVKSHTEDDDDVIYFKTQSVDVETQHREIAERNKEIEQICQSIYELNEMFLDLNRL